MEVTLCYTELGSASDWDRAPTLPHRLIWKNSGDDVDSKGSRQGNGPAVRNDRRGKEQV
jgi:hypothetical protein